MCRSPLLVYSMLASTCTCSNERTAFSCPAQALVGISIVISPAAFSSLWDVLKQQRMRHTNSSPCRWLTCSHYCTQVWKLQHDEKKTHYCFSSGICYILSCDISMTIPNTGSILHITSIPKMHRQIWMPLVIHLQKQLILISPRHE